VYSYSNLKYKKSLIKSPKKMTYVLGARCINGVVLVADRKFTISGGTDYLFDVGKLTGEISGIITGFSGDRGTFELFRNNIRDYIADFSINHPVTMDKILLKITEIMYDLDKKYHFQNDKIEVLVGIFGKYYPDKKSVLKYFNRDGRPIPINKYQAVGAGENFGSIYLKRYFNEKRTMEQIAELGHFIIKYIEKFELDQSVGLEDYEPDIRFIPDNPVDINKPDYTPDKELLKDYNLRINDRLDKLRNEPFFI
jgi:20S proteasome alpha/beta subunit